LNLNFSLRSGNVVSGKKRNTEHNTQRLPLLLNQALHRNILRNSCLLLNQSKSSIYNDKLIVWGDLACIFINNPCTFINCTCVLLISVQQWYLLLLIPLYRKDKLVYSVYKCTCIKSPQHTACSWFAITRISINIVIWSYNISKWRIHWNTCNL
jgi:hypothetical protein